MIRDAIPIIMLSNIKKCYNQRLVLDIPCLEITEKGRYVLVGHNGSGKTTLLNIIAGIEKADHGSIRYRDKEVNDKYTYRRKITVVMQSPYIFNTDVFHNIAYGLKVRGLPAREIEGRVWSVMERLGLGDFARRNGRQLSQGEMRKVAVARALAIDPEILLLDEPTSDLDRSNIQLLEAIINEFNGTTITATQSRNQAKRLAGNVITIKSGMICPERAPGPTSH